MSRGGAVVSASRRGIVVVVKKLGYCPDCRVPLRPFRLEKVLVDFCLRCSGMWLDRGELEALSGRRVAPGEKDRVGTQPQKGSRACPACSASLYRRELGPDSGVTIDECPTCAGVWLDKGELSAAKKYRKAMHKDLRRKGVGRRQAHAQSLQHLDEDSAGVVVFQYLTGLPLEMYVPQVLFPPVVMTLIGINVLVLAAALLLGDFEAWVRALGEVPSRISSLRDLHTLFTSMFVHGGVLHLVGNMYFLWVTGDNLEERFGPLRFLAFYLLAGLVAGLAQVLSAPSSNVPAIGASGAISGMLGAYVVLFPNARFLMRWFVFLWYHVRFEVPAYAYFIFWLLFQFLMAAIGVPGVGWIAHIAGFLCGALIAAFVRLRAWRAA
jgi:membrane associated rhomboid family serine protease